MPAPPAETPHPASRPHWSVWPALGLVRLYRLLVSPVIGPRCRYAPSCSEYAEEAFTRHGFVRGLKLTVARLSRCHPWGGSGYDPVPDE